MFDETGILEKSDKVNRGDEEVLDRYGVKESNTEGFYKMGGNGCCEH